VRPASQEGQAVGEGVRGPVAGDPAERHRLPLHHQPVHAPGRQVGGVHRLPHCTGRCRWWNGAVRWRRASTGITVPAVAVGGTSSQVMPVTSGAADSIASCTASSRVTDDEGQLRQLPTRRRWTTPSVRSTSRRDVAAVRTQVGRTPSSARSTRVGRSYGCSPWTTSSPATSGSSAIPVEDVVGQGLGVVEDLQEALQAVAVHGRDGAGQLLRPLTGGGGLPRSTRADPRSAARPGAGRPSCPAHPASLGRVDHRRGVHLLEHVPWPFLDGMNMCTPHGRQGSKLRTVRMMSMPLKFSLEFSSKIG
jgi:hypothetical protein